MASLERKLPRPTLADDKDLRGRLEASLKAKGGGAVSNLNVDVRQGRVWIRGRVKSDEARDQAYKCIYSLPELATRDFTASIQVMR